MRKGITFSLILFFVLFLFILEGCGRKEETDVIKIGVILPMTGDLASYGEPMVRGMNIALNEINNKSKNEFKLEYVDSKAEPSTAISGLQKLLNIDKVKYVIGDVSSPVTLALVPIMERNKAFLLSPGASSPKLRNISPFFARNYPSSVAESKESAEFLVNEKKILKSAIIYVNSEYGLGLKDVFIETFNEMGGEVVFSEAYEVGRSDFRNIIAKLNQTKSNAIYLGGNQKEMGNFMRQLRESGNDLLVISNISFLREDCLNIAGNAANGVIVPVAYYNPTDASFENVVKFSKLFKEKYEREVTIPNAVGYDALMLLATAIEKHGNDPEEVANYIRNLKNYNGALGLLNFTDGDVSMPMEFKVVQDGQAKSLSEKDKNI